jgi:hypothetical protein
VQTVNLTEIRIFVYVPEDDMSLLGRQFLGQRGQWVLRGVQHVRLKYFHTTNALHVVKPYLLADIGEG